MKYLNYLMNNDVKKHFNVFIRCYVNDMAIVKIYLFCENQDKSKN